MAGMGRDLQFRSPWSFDGCPEIVSESSVAVREVERRSIMDGWLHQLLAPFRLRDYVEGADRSIKSRKTSDASPGYYTWDL